MIDELAVGPFLIRIVANGVVIDCPEGTNQDLHNEIIEGPARGIVLLRQGYFVLHGSCLLVDGHVISIVGPSGAGKSTLAALLTQRGATLVSDGMTPVEPDTLLVRAGPPRTKLDDESLRLLQQEPALYASVHPQSTKRYFPVPSVAPSATESSTDRAAPVRNMQQGLGDDQLRLRLIFIVDDAEDTAIVPMAGARALIALITNEYLVEYLPPDHSAILMKRAAAVIRHGVQVRALLRKKDPSRLIEVAEAIERECASIGVASEGGGNRCSAAPQNL